jgi:hypothetical protein
MQYQASPDRFGVPVWSGRVLHCLFFCRVKGRSTQVLFCNRRHQYLDNLLFTNNCSSYLEVLKESYPLHTGGGSCLTELLLIFWAPPTCDSGTHFLDYDIRSINIIGALYRHTFANLAGNTEGKVPVLLLYYYIQR